jgi:predicted Zn finger-like uncharacterized protein
MRVQCPQCGVGGNIPDDKIPANGTKIVCPKCKTSFLVSRKNEAEQNVSVSDAGLDLGNPGPSSAQQAKEYYKEGVQLLKKKQVDAAIEQFTAALQINPEYPEAYRYLGLAYGQKNLWKDASQVLQKAITYKPDDVLSLKNLGVAYLQQKRFDEAEQVLQQALHHAPDDEKAQAYLSMATRGKKQPSQAPGEKQPPQTSTPTNQTAQIPEATPPVGDDAAASRRSNPVGDLLDRGTDFLDNAQYNKAIEAFQEVIRIAPNNSDGYFGLGMVHESRKDWSKAIDAYQKAVDLSPDDSLAKENLRFAKKQKKKFRLPFGKK